MKNKTIVINVEDEKLLEAIMKAEKEFMELFPDKKTIDELRAGAILVGYKNLIQELREMGKEELEILVKRLKKNN